VNHGPSELIVAMCDLVIKKGRWKAARATPISIAWLVLSVAPATETAMAAQSGIGFCFA
jgi:hypothetical protein